MSLAIARLSGIACNLRPAKSLLFLVGLDNICGHMPCPSTTPAMVLSAPKQHNSDIPGSNDLPGWGEYLQRRVCKQLWTGANRECCMPKRNTTNKSQAQTTHSF